MKNVVKYLLTVVSMAWTGALTFFSLAVITVGLFQFAEKFLNNNVVSSVILAVILICITIGVGAAVHRKL